MILRRKISQPVKFSSSSKFNKSFRGSPIGREEKHILRERLSKVKRRVFVCGRRCVTPYSNFWTDRFSSSFLPRVLHTVQHRSRPESADDVTFGLKQIRSSERAELKTVPHSARATFEFSGCTIPASTVFPEYIWGWNFGGSFSCEHFSQVTAPVESVIINFHASRNGTRVESYSLLMNAVLKGKVFIVG